MNCYRFILKKSLNKNNVQMIQLINQIYLLIIVGSYTHFYLPDEFVFIAGTDDWYIILFIFVRGNPVISSSSNNLVPMRFNRRGFAKYSIY